MLPRPVVSLGFVHEPLDKLPKRHLVTNQPFECNLLDPLPIVVDLELALLSIDLDLDYLAGQSSRHVIAPLIELDPASTLYASCKALPIEHLHPAIRIDIERRLGTVRQVGKGDTRWLIATTHALMGSRLIVKLLEGIDGCFQRLHIDGVCRP